MHLITGTNVGGAEMMLVNLLSRMDPGRFRNIVYSMLNPGPAADQIRALGIEVKTLGMVRGGADPRALMRLAAGIRNWRPHVLQTWMYHANLLGGLAGRLFPRVPVAWGIHHSDLDPNANPRMTIMVAKLCGLTSRWLPERIICCAESSRAIHAGIGYSPARMIVIPNGFELTGLERRSDVRHACAERFGIPPDAPVVSLVARYNPQKDHTNFIGAAKICRPSFPDTRFVLCGDGITGGNRELTSLIREASLEDRVILLGRRERDEVRMLMSRSTVTTTSSSWGEAFPMVVGEAMACGTVCVVTDVGDSAYLVGDTGIVVPPRAPAALAAGWMEMLSMPEKKRNAMGAAARQRIAANFCLSSVAVKYQNVYAELAEHRS